MLIVYNDDYIEYLISKGHSFEKSIFI